MDMSRVGAGALPPIFSISDDDHGGYAAVAVYTLLLLTVVVVATRLSARYYIGRIIQVDDFLLGGATIAGLVQSVIVQLAISHGLGQRQDIVSTNNLDLFQRYLYVAHILLILTIALSKLSIALLFKSLMSKGVPFYASWSLIGVITAWAVASIVALAVQCSSPHPWDFVDGKCIDQAALFRAIGAINMITDLGLIILPCVVLWGYRYQRRRGVPVAVAFQIHYYNIFTGSHDKTWTAMNASIWDQAVMNISIITTAIPSLGRLAVELQPNVGAFAMTENHGVRIRDKYALSSLANQYPHQFIEQNRLGTHTSVHGSVEAGDTESMEGLVRDGMNQNVVTIQQTIDFKVE
ncbi:hypothetical protein BGW36DRAFT_424948 [Talaromyces proteolyticus]|uniref:Rhodopsin domain-containing protein n=1 Tax=Talaromyces proteolyticus TaxID=1131652 RepID=A0AAD4KUA7_9EURO|nr:uncharacterized protein BGW36DRAFT_424948 [Talaromyces proteolyticus]KAH8700111.1 hypothetical protein BGW36DRAFT_424948 [Talaromyces proteolyticus]